MDWIYAAMGFCYLLTAFVEFEPRNHSHVLVKIVAWARRTLTSLIGALYVFHSGILFIMLPALAN